MINLKVNSLLISTFAGRSVSSSDWDVNIKINGRGKIPD
jgi:hypothetical protein